MLIRVPTIISIISLLTLANALPTQAVGKLPTTEPRSLLGRQYRDVRVRQPLAVDHLQPRQFNDVVFEREAEPLTRSARFYAIQRKRAQLHVRDEPPADHSENLLSNQSFGPPAIQNPITIPTPSPTLPNAHTPAALVSDPTQSARRRTKHSKSKHSVSELKA